MLLFHEVCHSSKIYLLIEGLKLENGGTRRIRTNIYGDLVYKFKRIFGKLNFSDQLKKIVKRYIRVGYNLLGKG